MKLSELKVGKTAIVKKVNGEGSLRQHFLDMGLIPNVVVTLIKFAPMGDPIEIRINSYELTLRLSEAENIEVEEIDVSKINNIKSSNNYETTHIEISHPGFGETGIFHNKDEEEPLENVKLTFALAGNQNCGKTTLFNQLTGANQHVGNFPGVTVDRKSGAIRGYPNTEITDLPGIYSLSPYTAEEIVSRQFIIEEKPKCIINIVDSTNIERNLYLTMQLLELETPMVLALNMMDELTGNGGSILINEMEQQLGIPVIPITASKNQGVDELIRHAIHVAYYQEKPKRNDFCDKSQYNGALHRCLHGIMHLIEDHANDNGIPVRFAATKLVEKDQYVLDALKLDTNEKKMIEHIITQMEIERGLDRSAAIADNRFNFITNLVKNTVIKPKVSKEHLRSEKIDKILTGKSTALLCFALIMALTFYLTFNVIGAFFQNILADLIDQFILLADNFLTSWNVNPVVHSLVIDGIFTGVGSVLSFLPIIVTLFFFLSLLEDTGYMARIAFIMDKPLRKIGLSGRSIVPMLVGFGCTVPAVMSSRTLPSDRDRKMTIMLTPFMSCTAKLPIYGFFTQLFFPKYSGLIMVLLYFMGIATSIVVASIAKNTYFKGEAVPFVMELPNYRMPSSKSVLQLLWEKGKDFITKAFTIIFLATIVIWFLQTFTLHMSIAESADVSILANIASFIAPVFKPLGFGDYRITTALISGFIAKESVVSTLNILFVSSSELLALLTTSSAFALLTFSLLYTPCIAAISAVKRELGGSWAISMVLLQCSIAYIVAAIVKVLLVVAGV